MATTKRYLKFRKKSPNRHYDGKTNVLISDDHTPFLVEDNTLFLRLVRKSAPGQGRIFEEFYPDDEVDMSSALTFTAEGFFSEDDEEPIKSEEEDATIDWESMTIAQIKGHLDTYEVTYATTANKADLIALAETAIGEGSESSAGSGVTV